ncbi:MAG: glutathione S-transferase family protein [Solirubrobacterales bacterium]
MNDAIAAAQYGKETSESGEFVRQTQRFRRWVRADGSGEFPAEAGRYHLYVSYACPWASRSILMRRLKGLEGAIGMTVVDPERDERSWRFGSGGGEPDPINGWAYLSEGYLATDPTFDDRVTVPVLWDKQTGEIVNNESSEVLLMLNSEFNEFAEYPELDYYPEDLRAEIDALNEWIYSDINNGVYRAGFATSQSAYETGVLRVFAALDRVEEILASKRYLTGGRITVADWRLAMTLFRFDPVYVGHFKCNIRRIVDYPNIWGYARELYQHPGVAETVNFDHIKRHYYRTHPMINPTRIVPVGPEIDWLEPHGRG